jgi:voltage-gated potassium channel
MSYIKEIARRLYTILKINIDLVLLAIIASSIIIFGGIGVYLAEHEHQGANITKVGDALWWAVVTITTVGYGDYYPVTTVGRMIAVFIMFSGIGILLLLIGRFQRSLQREGARLRSKTGVQPRLLGDETKAAIKDKIDEIEKLTEEIHRLLAAG